MGRLRGCLWLTAGLVVALLAGAIAFLALRQATEQRAAPEAAAVNLLEVATAARAIPIGTLLVAEDVTIKKLPPEAVPEGAVPDAAGVVGKMTLVDLAPGEIILEQRLVDPNIVAPNGRVALLMAEEQVLMAYPIADLMSRIGILKPGDHVDLLFTLSFPVAEGEAVATTFSLLENVTLAQIVGGGESGAPVALLFTLDPQDALILKYAKDAGGNLDIVLRAPGAEAPFETEPVDSGYLIDRYRIPAGGR